MAERTAIEWTDVTWNPVTGCEKISPGCDHCYAERFAERFKGVEGHPYSNGFNIQLHHARLRQPERWRKPRRVFVNSMSDLFHKKVDWAFVDRVFEVMERCSQHTFQVLTKRSSTMRRYLNKRYAEGAAPAHIWFGVSIEDRKRLCRVEHLRTSKARMRFLSLEPLLEGLGRFDLTGIDWVIVGGESGPGARKMQEAWALEVRDLCKMANVAFFFKQWGGFRPKSGGRLLMEQEYNEMPQWRE